ncbi:MAG: hypothetical protein IPN74_06310 [Haliscomenobacter sp.]|nr:hypothetical protein [Haliscomenobacter sp.]
MNPTALIMWLSAVLIVSSATAYFFYKVMVTPHGKTEAEEQPTPPVKSFDVS